jgi:hypothetical protein
MVLTYVGIRKQIPYGVYHFYKKKTTFIKKTGVTLDILSPE